MTWTDGRLTPESDGIVRASAGVHTMDTMMHREDVDTMATVQGGQGTGEDAHVRADDIGNFRNAHSARAFATRHNLPSPYRIVRVDTGNTSAPFVIRRGVN